MRSKWIYLLDILYEENCFKGLQIQIDRIKSNGSGDLEYVTNALAKLLLGMDASEDKEVLVNYSTEEKVNAVLSSYGTYEIVFEKETYLPTFNISGYTFIGYVDENNNIITKVPTISTSSIFPRRRRQSSRDCPRLSPRLWTRWRQITTTSPQTAFSRRN